MSTIQGLQSPSTYREAAAAQLRSVIGRRGTTNRQLAIAIGREPSYVNKRTRAEVPMTIDDIDAFSQALGVSPLELVPDWPASTSRVSSGSNGQLMSTTRVLDAEYLLCDNYAAA